jgi:phosphoglycolate phosphatase-like HAD superfamily hydrolase
MASAKGLRGLEQGCGLPERRHGFLLCLDSDGTVLDSMVPKHRRCFGPAFVRRFGLEKVRESASRTWEQVNLRSRARGENRFKALVLALEKLRSDPSVLELGFSPPRLTELEAWIGRSSNHSEEALRVEALSGGSSELRNVLAWSTEANEAVGALDPPASFKGARRALDAAFGMADVYVVSMAPKAHVEREWAAAGILDRAWAIAGQEGGAKAAQIATAKDLAPSDALMVGDAPGDYEAARAAGARFYPIIPGAEEESWARFNEHVLRAWLEGAYEESFERSLARRFLEGFE